LDEEDNSVSTPKVMRRKGQVLATFYKMVQVPEFEDEKGSGSRQQWNEDEDKGSGSSQRDGVRGGIRRVQRPVL
jgi:hypothetical protein